MTEREIAIRAAHREDGAATAALSQDSADYNREVAPGAFRHPDEDDEGPRTEQGSRRRCPIGSR